MKIAFIGLGRMGQPMAVNLVKAGHEVAVHNRTAARAEPVAAAGARVAASPADTMPAEFAITMLADDAAVEAALFGPGGLADGLPRGAVHISMSTISAALSQRLAEAHAARGQAYVAAPVFGRPEAAGAGKLNIVVAGGAEAVARCQPLFAALGQRTFPVGADPWLANIVKLAGNFLMGAAIESLAEAIALVRKWEIDPARFVEVMTGTVFGGVAYQGYGGAIAGERYKPAGFALPLGLKDIRLALAAAEMAGVPMPVASLVRDQAMSAIAHGWSDHDWSALGRLAAENAGLGREQKD